MKKYILSLCAMMIAVLVSAQETGSILIKNGTVLTITDGVKENTDVLMKD